MEIQTDYEALRWILSIPRVTRRLPRCHLRLSELEYDIVHQACVKYQATDALPPLKTKYESQTILYDEVRVLTIPEEIFPSAPGTDITDFEFNEDPKKPFGLLIPEVCKMAGIKINEKVELPTFAEPISAQCTDADCHSTFASVGKPNKRLNLDIDGMFVRVSALDGASQRVVLSSLRSRFLHFCPNSLLFGHTGERRV